MSYASGESTTHKVCSLHTKVRRQQGHNNKCRYPGCAARPGDKNFRKSATWVIQKNVRFVAEAATRTKAHSEAHHFTDECLLPQLCCTGAKCAFLHAFRRCVFNKNVHYTPASQGELLWLLTWSMAVSLAQFFRSRTCGH